MRRTWRFLLFVILALSMGVGQAATARRESSFNGGWHFAKGDLNGAEKADFNDSNWERISLPHTWNATDAVPGKKMYIGPAWYRKRFDAPSSWHGRRIFIRFGAASLKAQVFLNGSFLGEHKGGFGAFCYELTGGLSLGKTNEIAVRVNNTRGEIAPLAGDFTVFAGLYRNVALIETAPIAITPLDYASSGVYLKQAAVSAESATVDVTAKIDNGTDSAKEITEAVMVFDAKKRPVLRQVMNQTVPGRQISPLVQTISISHPHLWNGTADPYMYTARIEVFDGGHLVDSVDQPLGLRFYRFDPQLGLILNGKPMQIHGVCRHQDGGACGWAISEKDQDRDMRIMREMGVNGVRLAHYQHNPYFYTLCDKNGVLTWAELCLVNDVHHTPEFIENLHQQLRELIRQNFNHPAIVIWSMYNEVGSRGKPDEIVEDLGKLAHQEDPTRPTTGAASSDTMANLPNVMNALDLVSLNLYDGWYGGKPTDIGRDIDRYNVRYESRGVGVSEYGGGAGVTQHQEGMTTRPNPGGRWHPEEWQAILHEQTYAQIKDRPYVWGSFLWVMFDFPSSSRHEGESDGINDKGLVTRDRRIRKDAYYFYQANWTEKPMVYIASCRFVDRKVAMTSIKVYSNCQTVEVRLNGKSLGSKTPDAMHIVVIENVELAKGDNAVEAIAGVGGRTIRDGCHWRLQ